jgi:hypothetical protein
LEATIVFNLNSLSEMTQRERYADLLREADRERLLDGLSKPAGRGPAPAFGGIGRLRAAMQRLPRPAAGRRSPAAALN